MLCVALARLSYVLCLTWSVFSNSMCCVWHRAKYVTLMYCVWHSVKYVTLMCCVCHIAYTGPLKKLFHYAIFQKFFHIFIHKWSMFNHTCNLITMSFYFYKSYQRIIKQHLYIIICYIPIKHTTTYLNTIQ